MTAPLSPETEAFHGRLPLVDKANAEKGRTDGVIRLFRSACPLIRPIGRGLSFHQKKI